MLIPLIGFILGIPILVYTVVSYTGIVSLKQIPRVKKQKGNLLLALGQGLIAIALMLGITGYFSPINGDSVRYLRIIIGTAGLLLTGYQLGKIWLTSESFKTLIKRLKQIKFQEKLRRYWELLHVLVSRNLKVRYRGSFLGVYWSLFNPLIMTGLYSAIFGTEFAKYYNNSILNYVLAAFTGLVVINFFSASTTQALASVVSNGAMLNKIRLPVSIFPVSMIGANIFQFAISVFPLLAVMTLINSKSLVNVVALLLPFLALVLVCTGVGFLVSALYVFFRDLPYFYELIVFVLWISSPIFYPAEIVPKHIRPFLGLNPLSPIIESLRHIALSEGLPDFGIIGSALLSGIIILSLGWVCFHLWRSQFMDLL
ncbi:ABC-2 type transporter [Tolypothrix sp. NIES-4075]|nr:ABC-2 type transporter [Tolypothrix sp. NIES-4075]